MRNMEKFDWDWIREENLLFWDFECGEVLDLMDNG